MRSGWMRTAFSVALMGAAACGSTEDETTAGAPDAGPGGGATDSGTPEDKGPCTTAELFAGNPLYTGGNAPITGEQPLKPPVTRQPPLIKGIAVVGSHFFTVTQNQLWYADTSAANPTLKRVAGADVHGNLRDGACADARFDIAEDVVALPDGSLVMSDFSGNALLKVTDPAGAACRVSYLAGANAQRSGIGSTPIDPGDVDGPGLSAKLNGPEWLAAGHDGAVYFIDTGNQKVKKIALDAAATVSTVTTFGDGPGDASDWSSLTFRGGKLYAGAKTFGIHSYVIEIDPATGATKTFSKTLPEQFPILDEDGRPSTTNAVASDGERLFAAGGGLIWQVKDDGSVVHAAGGYSTKDLFDGFPDGVDFGAKVPAREAALKPYGGFEQWMTWSGDSLYWIGSHDLGRYVMKVSCPR